MAWIELQGEEEPTVTIKTNGKIHWNEAARGQMGDLRWVSLWFDEENNQLGFMACRGCSQYPRLRVYYDGTDYSIGARHRLDEAGIDYSEQQSAILQPPVTSDGQLAQSIHWIQLE